MTLNRILEKRGLVDAARRAGWIASTFKQWLGWSYPVYDPMTGAPLRTETNRICVHWKNAAQNGPKYAYPYGGPALNVPYYAVKGLRAQIEANKGILYLASGSPDVLTFDSVGLPALAWLNGECSVPITLAGDLARLGVHQVIYCPDLDATGKASAYKVTALLAGSLLLTIYRLPAELGESGDINRLWIYCRFNPVEFRNILANLPVWQLESKHEFRNMPFNQVNQVKQGQCPECAEAYYRRVFSLELTALANAPEHDRNNQLNRSAFALGTLLAAGIGIREEIERGLADVARLRGLTEFETAATIKSGLAAGLRKPRLIPIGSQCHHQGHTA